MSKALDPRASARRPLRLMVKSRVQSRVVSVSMLDISEGGCKIKGRSGFADVGDRVTMKVSGVYAPVGYVKWVNGEIAGITFEGEIHEAVLDHLCAAQNPDLSAGPDTTRRI